MCGCVTLSSDCLTLSSQDLALPEPVRSALSICRTLSFSLFLQTIPCLKKKSLRCSKIILTLFRLLPPADLFMDDCVNLLVVAAQFVFFSSADLYLCASGSSGSLERWIRSRADLNSHTYAVLSRALSVLFCFFEGGVAVSLCEWLPHCRRAAGANLQIFALFQCYAS